MLSLTSPWWNEYSDTKTKCGSVTTCPYNNKSLRRSTHGGGHSGFPVTYRKMKQLFAWQGMKTITKAFVQSCTTCQQAKPIRTKYPGLLSPLPVPKGAWHTISLDFIEGLPTSEKANCILVTVDKFYKYAHFVPLHHPFTAAVVAQ
jgi:hypothetical protein